MIGTICKEEEHDAVGESGKSSEAMSSSKQEGDGSTVQVEGVAVIRYVAQIRISLTLQDPQALFPRRKAPWD